MNNRINVSNWNQCLYQAAHENQADITSSFSELQPISNLTEYSSYLYHRVESSATADLRSPSTTSGEIQLSGELNSAALTQGHLEPSEPNQKFVSVPPEYRRNNEGEHTRISAVALRQRKRASKRVPVPPEYRCDNEDEHTRISFRELLKRKRASERVPIPQEYWRGNEDEHSRISLDALYKRKSSRILVPVPQEYRLYNEDEHTQISSTKAQKITVSSVFCRKASCSSSSRGNKRG
ncbi:MAG: hypothetical protein P8104_02170 [Gammaproteobacteria bacterium]